jgi:hypothetical protein
MVQAGAPHIAVMALGRVACGALAFRLGGKLHVAVAVKATFALVHDGAMRLVEPDPLVTADEPADDSPAGSLRSSTELVPYRPLADVLLRGCARAPQGQATNVMGVGLKMARGATLLLDKRLTVQGSPTPGGGGAEPAPFSKVPLVYELAAGGPGSAENPVGIAEGSGRWPNLLDAWRRPAPVGLGPLSPRWPVRKRLLGDRQLLEAPVLELDADFPLLYFNAAPVDQRIGFLQGDEWIGLDGMSPALPRVQSYLPGARGLARLYSPAPELCGGRALALVADTLSIDAELMRCSVVWRGSFGVSGEAELAALEVVAGVQTAEQPIAFPASYTELARRPGVTAPAGAPPGSPDAAPQTRRLAGSPAASSHSVMPFTPVGAAVEPRGRLGEARPKRTFDAGQTLALERQAAPALPFVPAPPAPREAVTPPLPPATPFERHAAWPALRTPQPAPPRRPEDASASNEGIPTAVAGAPAWLDLGPPGAPLPAATPDPGSRGAPLPEIAPPPLLDAEAQAPATADQAAAPSPEPPRTLGAFFIEAIARVSAAGARRDVH